MDHTPRTPAVADAMERAGEMYDGTERRQTERRAAPANKAAAELTSQLREYAGNPGFSHNDYADTMRAAAEEIDRLTRAAPAAQPDELRQGILRMAETLSNGEWADHLFTDPDLAALDAQISAALSAAPTARQPARNDVIEQCAQQVERMASNISPVELCGESVHEAANNVITNAAAAIRVLKSVTTTSQPDEARDAALEEFWGVYRTESDGSGDWLRDGPHIAQYSLGNAKRLCISPEYAPRRLLLVDGESAFAPTAASPSHPDPEKQKLECPDCGIDRLKAPCPRMADECAMVADAHLLHPVQQQEQGDERAAFEAAAPEFRINIERFKQRPDEYKFENTSFMWKFWQAATRAALAQKGK